MNQDQRGAGPFIEITQILAVDFEEMRFEREYLAEPFPVLFN